MRSSVRALGGATAIALSACGTGQSGGFITPGPVLSLRVEQRAVIPSMTIVTGVAISERFVFVSTPSALGAFDRQYNQWRPPFTRSQGWPSVNISAFMADPADLDAVWFAADNVVYHYRIGDAEVVRAFLPVRVMADMMYVDGGDPAAGLVVRTAGNSFVRVTPNGFAQPVTADMLKRGGPVKPAGRPGTGAEVRVVPQTVQSVFTKYRMLQDFQRVLTQDAALRSWPLLSAAAAPTQSEVWLGSGGGGVFKVDPLFAKSQQVPFGLLGDGAGAVAAGNDGVWIGGLGLAGSPRDGLTFTDNALRAWRWIDGGSPSLFTGARTTAIAQYASTLWAATDRGVMRVDAVSGEVERVWDGGGGIPLSLSATHDGVWVGTSRTVSFVHDAPAGSGRARVDPPVIEPGAVRSLARRGDTLWIASDAGVLVLPPGETKPRRLNAATNDPRLNEPIAALATADSVVAIATVAGVVLRVNVRSGVVMDSVSYATAIRVGEISGMAMDARTLWITGALGVQVISRENHGQQFLSAATDVGGEVFGVALTPQYAWLAARDGAVRLQRVADGMLR